MLNSALLVSTLILSGHAWIEPIGQRIWDGQNRRSHPSLRSKSICSLSATSPRWHGNTKHNANENALARMKSTKVCKMTFRLPSGEMKTFQKKRNESKQHVLTKAIIWALYADRYPEIEVELEIGHPRYLPDCVMIRKDQPIFWGESGRVSVDKGLDLLEQYPKAHLVQIRWAVDVDDYTADLRKAAKSRNLTGRRLGKAEYGAIPNDVWRFFDDDGTIRIEHEDIDWIVL